MNVHDCVISVDRRKHSITNDVLQACFSWSLLEVKTWHWIGPTSCAHFFFFFFRYCEHSNFSIINRVIDRVVFLWEWWIPRQLHIPVQTGGFFYFPCHRHQIEGADGFNCLLLKTVTVVIPRPFNVHAICSPSNASFTTCFATVWTKLVTRDLSPLYTS